MEDYAFDIIEVNGNRRESHVNMDKIDGFPARILTTGSLDGWIGTWYWTSKEVPTG